MDDETQLCWPPRQPHMQQQQGHAGTATDMGPSGVLDAFLSSRPAAAAAAARHRGGAALPNQPHWQQQQQPAFQTPARSSRPGGALWGADGLQRRRQGPAAMQGEPQQGWLGDDMAIDEPLEASEDQQHRRPPAAFAGSAHGRQRHGGSSRRWQQLAGGSTDVNGLPAAALPFSCDADDGLHEQQLVQQRRAWQSPHDDAWPVQATALGGAGLGSRAAWSWPAAAGGGMQGDDGLLPRGGGRTQQLGSWQHSGAPASPRDSPPWNDDDIDNSTWAAAAPLRGGAAARAWARGASDWRASPGGNVLGGAAADGQQPRSSVRQAAAAPWLQSDAVTGALFGGPVPARLLQQQQVDWAGAAAQAGAGASSISSGGGDSRLTIPAFMPHRNPSKQLLYRRTAAAGKGKQQAKLVWGSARRAGR